MSADREDEKLIDKLSKAVDLLGERVVADEIGVSVFTVRRWKIGMLSPHVTVLPLFNRLLDSLLAGEEI